MGSLRESVGLAFVYSDLTRFFLIHFPNAPLSLQRFPRIDTHSLNGWMSDSPADVFRTGWTGTRLCTTPALSNSGSGFTKTLSRCAAQVRPYITWHSEYVSQSDISKWLGLSDVYASMYEEVAATSGALLQAMAHGCAIVATSYRYALWHALGQLQASLLTTAKKKGNSCGLTMVPAGFRQGVSEDPLLQKVIETCDIT